MRKVIRMKPYLSCFLILLLLTLLGPSLTVRAEEDTGGTLALYELSQGKWYAVTDLILENSDGVQIVPVARLADILGLTHSYNSKKKELTIKNKNTYNVYTLNSKTYYTYTKSNNKITRKKMTADCKTTFDKVSKNYLCSINSLSNLIKMKSLAAKDYKYYKDTSYSSLLCLSLVQKVSSPPYFANVSTKFGRPLTVNQLKHYTSPDGKWSTKMYYMNGSVNGKSMLWPLNSTTSSVQSVDAENENVDISLEYGRYEPLDYSGKGISFTLKALGTAKTGVTYTMDDFSYWGFMGSPRDPKYQTTTDGNVDLMVDIDACFSTVFTQYEVTSYDPDLRPYITDFKVRFDVIDREQGIFVGYVYFETKAANGKITDVEGYFAECYKNCDDRPTLEELSFELYPEKWIPASSEKASSEKSEATVKQPSNVKTPNVKTPSLKYVPCNNCNGTGKVTCSICRGVGYSEHMGYQYGVYGRIVDPCLSCGGAGGRICSKCGGTGSVTQISTAD